jgi:PAS domain S-box-containing protein/putative nucleotidyltransferase with HDIG domain
MLLKDISIRSILDSSMDYIYIYDMEGRIIYHNPGAARAIGYSREELEGQRIHDLNLPVDISSSFIKDLEKTLSTGQACRGEILFPVRDKAVSVEYLLSPIYGKNGEVTGAVSSARDVTGYRLVEEKLAAERDRMAAYQDIANVFMGIFEPTGEVVLLNKKAEEILGYSLDELKGKDYISCCVPERYRQQVRDVFAGIVCNEGKELNDNPIVTRDGRERMIRWHNSSIRDNLGNVTRIICSGDDITDLLDARRRAENAAASYSAIFNSTGTAMTLLEEDSSISLVNEEFLFMSGYSKEEIIGRSWTEFVDPEDLPKMKQYHRLRRSGTDMIPKGYFFGFRCKNGELRRIWVTGSVIAGTGRSIVSLMDMTDFERTRMVAERFENRFKGIVQNTNVMIVLYDGTGDILFWNRTMDRVTGLSLESIWRDPSTMVTVFPSPEEYAKHISCAMKVFRDEPGDPEWVSTILDLNDNERFISWQSSSYFDEEQKQKVAICVGIDITERENALGELRESEREKAMILDSMGEILTFQDRDHRVLFANRASREFLGLSEEEIIGKRCYKLWGNSSEPCKDCPVEKARVSGKTETGEILCPDGTWWRSTGNPIYGKNGDLLGFLEVASDITREKDIRELTLKAERKYRYLFNASGSGLVIIDSHGIILKVNRAFENITKLDAKRIEGKVHYSSFFSPETLKGIREQMYSGPGGEVRPFRHECEAIVAGGQKIRIGVVVAPMEEGENFIVSMEDQTELVEARWTVLSSLRKLKKMNRGVVSAISQVTELRDPYTAGHQKRVADLACAIARKMNMTRKERDVLNTAALLHDVGKIHIPSEILNKPGRITDLEYSIIKVHAEAGYNILKNIEFEDPVAEIVRQHHERLNGSGYPKGLEAGEILLEARILAVADVVEAMVSHRPYRAALGVEKALTELERGAGTLYDRDVIRICIELFREDGFSFTS